MAPEAESAGKVRPLNRDLPQNGPRTGTAGAMKYGGVNTKGEALILSTSPLVVPERLELSTYGLEDRYSIQLS